MRAKKKKLKLIQCSGQEKQNITLHHLFDIYKEINICVTLSEMNGGFFNFNEFRTRNING